MKQLPLTIILLSLIHILPAQSVPPLPGWKVQEQNGHYVFKPVALFSGGKTFVYELMPPVKQSGQTTETWFRQAFERDIQQSDYTQAPTDNKKVGNASGLYTYATQVTDKAGKTWYLSYIACAEPNGQYRFARLVSSPDMIWFKNYTTTAMGHFTKLAKQEGFAFNKNEGGNTTTGTGSSAGKTSAGTGNKPKAEDFYTENGLKAAQIKGVVINLEYGFGVGGMMISEYNPYLLLTDGTIYDGPRISPYKFDVAKSKQLEPRKWGTWKETGSKTILINWPDKERPQDKTDTFKKNWFWARPAINGEKITGSYNTISGGGNTAVGGNVMVVSASNITFNNNGQFTFESVGGGSNSGDFGVSSTAYASKEGAGTYLLDGYSIEMRFNNGKVQQQLFYFYPDSKEVFNVGGRDYTPADATKKKKK